MDCIYITVRDKQHNGISSEVEVNQVTCVCTFQVKTKTVSQCVEFYYLSKRLLDKQAKQKEEESRVRETEQQESVSDT